MISARDLYKKIKEKYPDFRAPKRNPNEVRLPDETDDEYYNRIFGVKANPPLTEEQLNLLEMGFPVKLDCNPFFYGEPSESFKKFVDKVIKNNNRKVKIED